MKWFQHDSNASNDAKIKKLILRHGAYGYAVYFHCVELIANDLDVHNITFELQHDAEIIADNLKIVGDNNLSGVDLVTKIMRTIIELGLFETNNDHITCLKLAKRLDRTTTQNPKFKELMGKVSENKQIYDTNVTESDTKSTDYGTRRDNNKRKKNKEEINKEKEVPEWKKSFENYQTYIKDGFNKICGDTEIIKEFESMMSEVFPNVDIGATIKHGYHTYWYTEDGYEKKKKQKAKEINFKSLIRNILKSTFNHKLKNSDHSKIQGRG